MNRVAISLFLALLFLPATSTHAQGRFSVTLTGFEMVGGQALPVKGNGTLQLFGSTLDYFITVPVTVLPAEAHFHGPVVGSGMPQFSLVPFEAQPAGGIVYRGSYKFDPKYVPDIQAGKWYINLHSPNYDNGVLSGYILPVPEANAILLFLIGGILVRVLHRSRKSRGATV